MRYVLEGAQTAAQNTQFASIDHYLTLCEIFTFPCDISNDMGKGAPDGFTCMCYSAEIVFWAEQGE